MKDVLQIWRGFGLEKEEVKRILINLNNTLEVLYNNLSYIQSEISFTKAKIRDLIWKLEIEENESIKSY